MKVAAIQNISSYSLLESPIKIKDLLINAKEKGYSGVSLTDINVTYGLVDFYELAKKIGIKPLLGMQARLNGLIDSTKKYDLIILAKNNNGYSNLLRLSSAINLLTANGTNEKVLTLTELKKYLADLVIITPANVNSELCLLQQKNEQLGDKFVETLQNLLPKSTSLYLGVYADEEKSDFISYVQALAQKFSLNMAAVEDTQYLRPKDQFLRRTLLALKQGRTLENTNELARQEGSHFLKYVSQLSERYGKMGLATALENTATILDECNAEVTFKAAVLPKYKQDKFKDSKSYLQNLAQEGLQKRLGNVSQKYQDRLDYELGIINQMGFDDYFLIVWDVINYCHQVGITTGPGRGSACGSLVSYALKITEIDPLKYHLLFERFLNPARHEMPDIDLDIPDNRRDDVIRYMYKKYGMNHAAQILAIGTLATKQVIRDTARVFGKSVVEINKWAKAIPYSKDKIDLTIAYKNSRDLRILTQATEKNKLLFDTARQLEGIPRHYSIHAAGLVISDDSIAGIAGLQAGQLGIPVTQQTKKYVESLGLLKIDFLGLRNLTILGNILSALEKRGQKINPNDIPLDDSATLALFQAGDTDAVFQFESSGIRNVLRRLHPDNFEDLVAVNALYRPGPMQNISSFTARKLGKETVTYPDPSLKKILAPTYGVLVYQEQVMQTAQVLAGFSLGEADILRRAMSKKNKKTIEQERNKFISGTVKNGHSREVGEKVYQYIEQFANYGFNRSHAVAYTEIAFWLAYLKVHYPAEFYTAMLNSVGASSVKAQDYIMRAQEKNVRVLPPDINKSGLNYRVIDGQILVGLRAIKGLRNDFVQEIKEIKKPVKSLSDFLRKVDVKFLRVEAISSLIKAGSFDQIESNRNQLLANCADLIGNVKLTGQNVALLEVLGGVPEKKVAKPNLTELSAMEEEVLGFSITTTPLVAVQKYAQKFNARQLSDFAINDSGIGVGKLLSLKLVKTKKMTTMAFTTFADLTSRQEIVIFPAIYEKVHHFLEVGGVYLIGIKVGSDRYDSGKKQYIMTNLKEVNFKNK